MRKSDNLTTLDDFINKEYGTRKQVHETTLKRDTRNLNWVHLFMKHVLHKD